MKNKTVQLVNEWAVFEERHPRGSIADFCHHYLARQEGAETGSESEEETTAEISGELMKIITRIGKLNTLYANLALKGSDLGQLEELGMLYTISQEQSPKKSEVIHANLLELSSGTDILNRIKRRGLIKEVVDRQDRRSKRIVLTAKGTTALESGSEMIGMNAKKLTAGLTADEKKLIIHLLKDIALKFSSRWMRDKGLSLEI